ncbi:PIG-L deacetylase family protein [Spirochaetota bacterium]
MKKTIAVIAAHADDVELGAGGTLAKYIDQGYKALYGVMSRCNSGYTVDEKKGTVFRSSLDIIPLRRKEALAAAKVFGAELYFGDILESSYTTRSGERIFPSYCGVREQAQNSLDDDDIPTGDVFPITALHCMTDKSNPVIDEIVSILVKWEPELVIGQYLGNLNPDHNDAAQILGYAWNIASKKADIGPYWLPCKHPKGEKLLFPPLKADKFVDVTGYEDTAEKAIACHRSQGGDFYYRDILRKRWKNWGEEMDVTSGEAFYEVYTKDTINKFIKRT